MESKNQHLRSRWMSTFLYLKNMIRDKNIASITPTSHAGVKRVCERIDFSKPNVIVEYGPATGVFTYYLLERLSSDSRLILIERNQEFVRILKDRIQDERVSVYGESAEQVQEIVQNEGLEQVDYIISGIPFSFFSDALRDEIVRKTHAVLRPQGKFLPYQTFFQKDKHLYDHLVRYFSDVRDEIFIYNVPPMRIYEAVK